MGAASCLRFQEVFRESRQPLSGPSISARTFDQGGSMWTDDDLPSHRSHSLGELSPIDKIIDSDEFDLGIADLIDSDLEMLKSPGGRFAYS